MNAKINRHIDSDGKYHREDGPAVEYSDGSKSWYIHGERHREDGPACEYSCGTKWWYKHGKAHREDGPAYEKANGYKYYWLEDIEYTEKEYWKKIKELKKCKLFKLKGKEIGWV